MRESPVNDEKLLLEMSETDVTIFPEGVFYLYADNEKIKSQRRKLRNSSSDFTGEIRYTETNRSWEWL